MTHNVTVTMPGPDGTELVFTCRPEWHEAEQEEDAPGGWENDAPRSAELYAAWPIDRSPSDPHREHWPLPLDTGLVLACIGDGTTNPNSTDLGRMRHRIALSARSAIADDYLARRESLLD